ncbi:hypothetical protein SISNIDRAFT_460143 [Sistotremastrum niveocremeum HHB9708]|uniref:Uncharacterized protein n=2 Tax=Sistotremastraceae TaxID=3402574 RepID=A0A164NVK5_9AGAM|nr:hypothetical protein SISNIDRAFT_460143 [Sistotremastrum niveocremeum HHB9708]KZT40492.1 hypothetical protein SISSUDRAFT_1044207 [Sistotremastrum suecicum HHB10207 ss-3]
MLVLVDEPLSKFRGVLSKVRAVQVNLCNSLHETVANISERSNKYVDVARLPREILAEVFARFIHMRQHSEFDPNQTDLAFKIAWNSDPTRHPLISTILQVC